MQMQAVLHRLFSGAQAVGAQGVFQFVFSGQDRVWASVGEHVVLEAGMHPAADVTIELATEHFIGILEGEEDVEDLFASGRLKISGQMGLATLLPQMISAAQRGEEAAPAKAKDQRYPAPEREADRVSQAQPWFEAVERCPHSEMSVARFREQYQPIGKPVIITGALSGWPLFNMTLEESAAHFGDVQGISRHGDYVSKTFSSDRDFRQGSMAEFIKQLDAPAEPGNDARPAYMGNNAVPAQLMEHIRLPEYFDEALYIKPRIWIGPKGTLTPLHRDDSDNLFAQVWGQKSFILAAPHHREALGTWSTSVDGGLEGCAFNPDAPDYEAFPAAREVTFYRIVLQAGDLLFLPDGWFHQVESVTTSLSVNFWVTCGRGWSA